MTPNLLLSAATTALLTPTLVSAALAQETIEDEIFVSASPLERPAQDAVVGVSTLSGQALQRKMSGTLGETLRKEPGISDTAFGAGASRPIIRGQGGDRIRVLDNGVGTIDASASSPDHAAAVTPALAEKIEIIRGSGLLRYGSSAAGGVVNVIDSRLSTEVPEDGIDAALRLSGTTVDDGWEAAAGANLHLGNWGGVDLIGHGSFELLDAGDYDIPGFAESAALRALEEEDHDEDEHEEDGHEEEEEIRDTLENSFVEVESGAVGLSAVGERGFLAVALKSTSTTYGLPGGHEHGHEEDHEEEHEDDHDEEHGEEEEEGVFIVLDQVRFDVTGGLQFESGPVDKLRVYAGIADYTHTEFEGPGEPGTVFENDGYEARAELIRDRDEAWRTVLGAQIRHRDYSAIGEEAFVPPTSSDQVGVYGFAEKRTDKSLIEGAIRFETTDHERVSDGATESFETVSASIGFGIDVTDTFRLSGNGLRTERAPAVEELFANGPHLATGQFEVGDPTLDVETATGVEIIAQLDLGAVRVGVTGFATSYEDYIFAEETGDEEDELPVFAFTAEDADFIGFEAVANATLGAAAGMDFSGDLVLDYVEAETDAGPLPLIPPLGLTVGLNAECDKLALRAEVEHAGEQDDVAAFELATEAYTLLNLYADWTLPNAGKDVVLSAAWLNATDEEARVHSSFLKDEVPLPGQNVRVSLRVAY